MGRRLVALAQGEPELCISGAVEQPGNPAIGADAGEIAGVGKIGVEINADLSSGLAVADVAIAFVNNPAASIVQARICSLAKKPLIVGSTGLTADEEKAFNEAATGIAVVKASNFGIGITVLLRLVEEAARLLGPAYNCEVVESHHTQKKDAPSGTALSLAEAVARAWEWNLSDSLRHGREGLVGERRNEEIGMHSLRAGDIVGHHSVLFGGTGETLEFIHRAQSRDTFAMGALRAAQWIVGKPAGRYSMRDVLGLK
jgi:4-hydroxy-tetrahydrodipicolinate reductase